MAELPIQKFVDAQYPTINGIGGRFFSRIGAGRDQDHPLLNEIAEFLRISAFRIAVASY